MNDVWPSAESLELPYLMCIYSMQDGRSMDCCAKVGMLHCFAGAAQDRAPASYLCCCQCLSVWHGRIADIRDTRNAHKQELEALSFDEQWDRSGLNEAHCEVSMPGWACSKQCRLTLALASACM